MKFLVLGAGAIGMYIASRIVTHSINSSICILGREQFGQSADGKITVDWPGSGRCSLPMDIHVSVDSLSERAPFDCVIFATKAYALEAAVAQIATFPRLFSESTRFLCLQNGIGSEEVAVAAFGVDRVMAGTVTTPVSVIGAAHIRIERERGIGLARQNGAKSVLTEAEAGVLRAMAGTWYANAQDMKWSKLLLNLVGNASGAIFNMTVPEIYRDPSGFEIEYRMLRECLAVMSSMERRAVDLPGGPARQLALLVQVAPKGLVRPLLGWLASRGRGHKRPSLYYELENKTGRTEVGFLNGAIAEAGAVCGVATPINACLSKLLLDISQGATPWRRWRHQPTSFLHGCMGATLTSGSA